ncbi:MAG TPA: hypothetical protein VMF07_03085 [Solirubrobacteraceae bacterium]|nr:hypothetical protein [Solirubrobacteraceae bacterium]
MRPRTLTAGLAAGVLTCAGALTGCGSASTSTSSAIRTLEAEARPIGRGPRFQAPVRGRPLGRCGRRLGPREAAHIELFAENRVVLVAAGVGVRGPRRYADGRIVSARCYGALVTLDPTGVVLVRPRTHLTLAGLFRSWGQPLSPTELAGFSAAAGQHVRIYVDGRLRRGNPRTVPLTRHAEIVLEVGPHVPPHRRYTFPPGPSS